MASYIYIYTWAHPWYSCHKAVMVMTGRAYIHMAL